MLEKSADVSSTNNRESVPLHSGRWVLVQAQLSSQASQEHNPLAEWISLNRPQIGPGLRGHVR
jgi:hypothetical protein